MTLEELRNLVNTSPTLTEHIEEMLQKSSSPSLCKMLIGLEEQAEPDHLGNTKMVIQLIKDILKERNFDCKKINTP